MSSASDLRAQRVANRARVRNLSQEAGFQVPVPAPAPAPVAQADAQFHSAPHRLLWKTDPWAYYQIHPQRFARWSQVLTDARTASGKSNIRHQDLYKIINEKPANTWAATPPHRKKPTRLFVKLWHKNNRDRKKRDLTWWMENEPNAADWRRNLNRLLRAGWQLGRRAMQDKYKETDNDRQNLQHGWSANATIPSQRFIQAYLSATINRQRLQRPGHRARSIMPFQAGYPNEALQLDTAYLVDKNINPLNGFIAMIDVATRHGYAQPVHWNHNSTEAAGILLGTIGEDDRRPAPRSMLRQAEDVWINKGFPLNPIREKKPSQPVDANGRYEEDGPILVDQDGDPIPDRTWMAPGVRITKIVSDKGSEFEGEVVKRMKKLQGNVSIASDGEAGILGKYKQQFSFEGKSQANGLVERFNKTIKGLVRGLLPRKDNGDINYDNWHEQLPRALEMYNDTRHGVIRHKPASLTNTLGPNYYKRAVWNVAKRVKQFHDTGDILNVGDYVRVIRYNASKAGVGTDAFTTKGGTLVKMLTPGDDPALTEQLQGLYLVERVFTPKNHGNSAEDVTTKARTYGVVGLWHHAGSTEVSMPTGGISRNYTAKHVDTALATAPPNIQSIFRGRAYPPKTTMRRFVRDELHPAAQTADGTPDVIDIDIDPVSDEHAALARSQVQTRTIRKSQRNKSSKANKGRADDTVYNISHVVATRREKGGDKVKIRWEGYGPKDDTWEPYVPAIHKELRADYLRKRKKAM